MSELRIETWTMPAAPLGPENPLPPLGGEGDLHARPALPGLPDAMAESIDRGHPRTILPYTLQDGYSRRRAPRGFRVAVLENEILRAGFLLEHGGRLWSLLHKPSGRELIYRNPVFQPANLAVRNAWFSGGVEWNIGIIGHSPLTCDPVFAARVERADGTPVLRLYEWERIRQVPYQIDACLPPGSPVLLVRVRIANPHRHEIPMYWWSNMAAPESPETRVLAPATEAYHTSARRGFTVVNIPEDEGTDVSYATNHRSSADFFFRIPPGERPWIAALDGQGRGLVQTSTARLPGRKLFVWGMGPGGRRWQEFLSEPGHPYLEIQAGLGRTQMEYVTMPAGADWAWVEAYGLLEADAAAVHGTDWSRACRAAGEALERLAPRAALDDELARGEALAEQPPLEILHRGSGWGALERKRRAAAGAPPFCGPGLLFDDESLAEPQAFWLDLLARRPGAVGQDGAPRGYLAQPEWRALLEQAVGAERADDWQAWLHLGVMRHWAGDRAGGREAWQRSLACAPAVDQVWPLRNLAALAREEGMPDRAAESYVAACRLAPALLPLAVECGRALLQAGRAGDWLALLPELASAVRESGRVRLLEAQAALETGDLDRVEAILAARPVVEDLREGEVALSHLWFAMHEQRLSRAENLPLDDALRARVRRDFPVPSDIDFRMKL